MSHDHTADTHDFSRAFAIGIVLNTVYVAVEAGVGLAVGSLGLVADAGHNASDVLSLIVAWVGAKLAQREPTERYSYGLSRSPILASLFNALLLFAAMGVVAWEAIGRLQEPSPVPGSTIIWVTTVGLVVNVGTALMFVKGRSDLNIRGAFLHMAADAGVTLGVLLSGIAIIYTGAEWIDPAIGLLIVVVVLWSTWGLFRESMRLSLEAVPEGIDPAEVRQCLKDLPGVAEVHDLHIWAMSTTETALTAHIVTTNDGSESSRLVRTAATKLRDEFDIEHTTLQLETESEARDCHQESQKVV